MAVPPSCWPRRTYPSTSYSGLRTNLCLEGPTKPRKPKGQPPKHGIPFKFKDPYHLVVA